LKSALVIGGAGFLGSKIAGAFGSSGYAVTSLDIAMPGDSHESSDLRTISMSLPDAAFGALLSEVAPDVLDHSLNALDEFLSHHENAHYIGTRLHCGIHCLCRGLKSLILQVDNRAAEISKDTGLLTCQRGDLGAANRWITCAVYPELKLPLENITLWKNAFAASMAKCSSMHASTAARS
jgi:hypothetical protein